MDLSTGGESRVRGYLYVLERSLRTFLPFEQAGDAVREVESHIRDRAAEVQPVPDERTALERVLMELGPPLKVAQAYSLEMTTEEAVATGRIGAVLHSLLQFAALGVRGFFSSLALFVGYALGLGFLAIAILKPIFPANVGLFVVNGIPRSFGAQFPPPAGAVVVGGYWIVPIAGLLGVAILVGVHAGARRVLASWLERRRALADIRFGIQQ